MKDHDNDATSVEIEFDQSAALLCVSYSGAVTYQALSEARERAADAMGGRAVVGVVIDVRKSNPAYSAEQLADSIESGLSDAAFERCAILAGPEREELVASVYTTALANGVRVRAFSDDASARRWAAGG